MSYVITTATSREEAARAAPAAVLPIGSLEQHGDHLPLSTDTIVAAAIAREISRAHELFLLPPVTISCSHEHATWPGTVSISARTLYAIVDDVTSSLARSGITKLILVNGHGGNYVLGNIVQETNVNGPRMTLFPNGADRLAAREAAGLVTNDNEDMHGGEWETSILLHVHPQTVRPGNVTADHEASERPHLLVHGLSAYSTSGIVGRPSLGTAAKGKAILDSLVASFADHLDVLDIGR